MVYKKAHELNLKQIVVGAVEHNILALSIARANRLVTGNAHKKQQVWADLGKLKRKL